MLCFEIFTNAPMDTQGGRGVVGSSWEAGKSSTTRLSCRRPGRRMSRTPLPPLRGCIKANVDTGHATGTLESGDWLDAPPTTGGSSGRLRPGYADLDSRSSESLENPLQIFSNASVTP